MVGDMHACHFETSTMGFFSICSKWFKRWDGDIVPIFKLCFLWQKIFTRSGRSQNNEPLFYSSFYKLKFVIVRYQKYIQELICIVVITPFMRITTITNIQWWLFLVIFRCTNHYIIFIENQMLWLQIMCTRFGSPSIGDTL